MKNNNGSVEEWIIRAQNDLKSAKILYKEKGPSDALCFHCHQSVATSITKKFEPKWLDEKTLEYNNPNDTGRITKQIF